MKDWIKDCYQFLSHSLVHLFMERIGKWTRQADFRNWFGHKKIIPYRVAASGDQVEELSYHYNSLHCRARIRNIGPTPGMQFIYRALQRSHEA